MKIKYFQYFFRQIQNTVFIQRLRAIYRFSLVRFPYYQFLTLARTCKSRHFPLGQMTFHLRQTTGEKGRRKNGAYMASLGSSSGFGDSIGGARP
jgi:hypothetical protein